MPDSSWPPTSLEAFASPLACCNKQTQRAACRCRVDAIATRMVEEADFLDQIREAMKPQVAAARAAPAAAPSAARKPKPAAKPRTAAAPTDANGVGLAHLWLACGLPAACMNSPGADPSIAHPCSNAAAVGATCPMVC